jgi:hypothetical protein
LGHHSGSEEYDDKAEGFPQMSPTVAAWLGWVYSHSRVLLWK